MSIVLTSGRATLSRIGSSSSQSNLLFDGLSGKFRRDQISVRVGGDGVSTIDSVGARGGFRGCVRDLRLLTSDSTFVAMETTAAVSGNATWGVCNRSPQCVSPSPCQTNTSLTCSDLWNDFVCSCQPDFGGRICCVQLPSFTFGLHGNVSSASFSSLPPASNVYGGDVTWTIELRLLTLYPRAFLLLLGDPSDSATSPRLLATIQPTGRLSAQLQHSNGSEIVRLESQSSVVTGSFEFVRISVSISRRILSLTASSSVTTASFSNISSLSQLSGHLIIGGFNGAAAAAAPELVVSGGGNIRTKRSLPSLPSSVANSYVSGNVTGFRGILSSAKLNEVRPLILGSVDASLIDSLPGALAASDSTGVVTGAKSEKVCATHSPCMNGGACTDVFFNSYSCKCPVGWAGANCSQADHCFAGAKFCPNGTECVNVDHNGFECRTSATFGSSRHLSPATHLNLSVSDLNESLATVIGWSRTRQSDCQLVSVSSSSRQLSIKCNSSHLQASLDDQTALVSVAIATGVPFNFSVGCSASSPLSLRVSINGSDVITATARSQSPIATGLMLNSVAMVTLGGAQFKGCLGNVRLNGHLAPLVNRSLPRRYPGFTWQPSANQNSAAMPLIGCHDTAPFCFVNPDHNPCIHGQCKDLVNNYICDCYRGWVGQNCSVNPDDCVTGGCLNGGKCVDGNATFTCDCSGTDFEGTICSTWINDCQPSPCLNGGSCIDGVRNYSCICLSGYSGINCSVDFADCSPNPCEMDGFCLERSNPTLYNLPSLPWPFNGSFSHPLAAGFMCLNSPVPSKNELTRPTLAVVSFVAGVVLAIILAVAIVLLLLNQYHIGNLSLGKFERSSAISSPDSIVDASAGRKNSGVVEHPYMFPDKLPPTDTVPYDTSEYTYADTDDATATESLQQQQTTHGIDGADISNPYEIPDKLENLRNTQSIHVPVPQMAAQAQGSDLNDYPANSAIIVDQSGCDVYDELNCTEHCA